MICSSLSKPFTMIKYGIIICLILIGYSSCAPVEGEKSENADADQKIRFALVIHGGAGAIKKENMSAEREKAYSDLLQRALDTGYAELESGGTAIEAVRKSINLMENSPLFNAGKGAVLNSLGKQEMDASIMEGKNLNAGAVAGVSRIKNPIDAAILVKDSSSHVMLSGKGAEDFAVSCQMKLVEESYFFSERRLEQLKRIQAAEQQPKKQAFLTEDEDFEDHKYGTVGCVAIDLDGNIVAGTSTGGMTNKKYGRIGDSPIIGAGNYANNETCGISCTGTGEYFMRTLAAHEASNLMQYQDLNLAQAMNKVIAKIGSLGGTGGMIGLDKDGRVAWDFNTAGMFRAYKNSEGENSVELYEK